MKNSLYYGALFLSVFVGLCIMSTCELQAFQVGGGAGMDFPFAHRGRLDPGVAVDAFAGVDPYEFRFHFDDTNEKDYSVSLVVKHFFSKGLARPYMEAALGPLIVDEPHRSLFYGFKPEVGVGADIAISSYISMGVSLRYFGLVYFGNTRSGWIEANNGLSLIASASFWF